MNTVPRLAEASELNHLLSPANMKRAKLKEFCQVAHTHLGKADDATFEPRDAIVLTRNVYSLADLSLSPVKRAQMAEYL